MSKRVRTELTNQDKLEIVQYAEKQGLSHADASRWWRATHPGSTLSEDAICKWRKLGLHHWEQLAATNKESKHNRQGMFPTLETTLFIWIKQVCCEGRCMQYDAVKQNFNSL